MWTIATRKSRLAMWQAEHVQLLMQKTTRFSDVEILGLSTKGDEILDRSLSKIGGKGLFVKELKNKAIYSLAPICWITFADISVPFSKLSFKDKLFM